MKRKEINHMAKMKQLQVDIAESVAEDDTVVYTNPPTNADESEHDAEVSPD